MRILLLAPVHREEEHLGKGSLPFPRSQAQSSWVIALQKLGHKVTVFRYTDGFLVANSIKNSLKSLFEKYTPIWTARYYRLRSKYYFLSIENFIKNKKLLHLAKQIKPELIIISGGISNIYPSAIGKIKKEYGCKVLLFSGVNPDVAATAVEKYMVKHRIVDVVVENDRGYAKKWEKLNVKTLVLPISSIDPEIHQKLTLSKKEKDLYASDICFVGSLTYDRQKILTNLLSFNIRIWGDIPIGIKLDKKLEQYYYGEAFGEKMIKIFNAAKIVLNFQPKDMTHGGNMRTFEIPGCYAFQLADRIDPDFLIEGKEYDSFRDLTDLKKKIKYYLQNESKKLKIAKSGAVRVRREHTYEKHFKKLLSKI